MTTINEHHKDVLEEAMWLLKYPHFKERPASLVEFLGADYLDLKGTVRLAIQDVLSDIMGQEVNPWNPTVYPLAIVTGGIGIGKTTIASIVLPYLVHWTLCLRDPHDFFGMMPGSRIAFMQMSTSEDQAAQVVFGDIKARIEHSPWFQMHPPSSKFTKQFRWIEEDIWIIPGDSAETTFEGYNILGGILDEADSHKVTDTKDYADQGFETISNRMSSRFDDKGFVLIIGQMKRATGFAARKFAEFQRRADAYAVRMTIWEARGDAHYVCHKEGPHPENLKLKAGKDCGQVHKFWFDPIRKQILPDVIGRDRFAKGERTLMNIPTVYRIPFEQNPEKALKDLAGIPPKVGDAFISLDYKITEAIERWQQTGDASPVLPDGRIAPWFKCLDPLPRAIHVDIGYASEGDALGIAMGHVRQMIDVEGELKPYIVIDFIMRMSAPAGGEIFLGNMRRVIYELRDKLGFKIRSVSFDGFQSQDTIQQLRKRRFKTDYLSIDKQKLPYEDLREAIYEDRIELPPLMCKFRPEDTELTSIIEKELSELIDTGPKIDHPEYGSKDVADAIAGVTYALMGDRKYRSGGVVDLGTFRDLKQRSAAVGGVPGGHPAYLGGDGMRAPVPPTSPW
jgi:hypothetical protein